VNVQGVPSISGPGAYRGLAVHDFFAGYVKHLHRTKRQTDFEALDSILAKTLQKYPALTLEQHEDIRSQAKNLVRGFVFNPDTFYGVETPLELQVDIGAGRTVTITGRLDFLEVGPQGNVAWVGDVKSNHVIWPDSQVCKDFQLRVYAALVFANMPGIERVYGRLLMSRYGIGLPQKGEASWDREDTWQLLEHLASRLAAHFEGRLKNERVPGTWCGYCPLRRPGKCSLYKSYYGTTPAPPLNDQQARKLARQVIALEQARDERIALLKDYVNEHGPVRVGSGEYAEVFGYHTRESEDIPAAAIIEILQNHADLVGAPPLDELLSVNKRSKAFKQLRRVPELADDLSDAVQITYSTTFTHKRVGGAE